MRFAILALVSFAAVANADPVVEEGFLTPVPFPVGGRPLPLNGRVVFFGPQLEGRTFTRDGAALPFEPLPIGFRLHGVAFIVDPGVLVAGVPVSIETESGRHELEVIDFVDSTPPVFVTETLGAIEVSSKRADSVFGIEGAVREHVITARLPSVSDDGGSVLVRTESDEGTLEITGSDGGLPGEPIDFAGVASFSPGPPRRACFEVFAVDVAGNETQFPTPICANIGNGGCAQTSPSDALVLAVVALLVRRRRPRADAQRARARPMV